VVVAFYAVLAVYISRAAYSRGLRRGQEAAGQGSPDREERGRVAGEARPRERPDVPDVPTPPPSAGGERARGPIRRTVSASAAEIRPRRKSEPTELEEDVAAVTERLSRLELATADLARAGVELAEGAAAEVRAANAAAAAAGEGVRQQRGEPEKRRARQF